MEILNVPRFMISGSGAGAGKFFFGLGLGYELKRRGMSVSACVVGANISQAAVHRRVIGRFVRCLDPNLLSADQLLVSAFMASGGADILIVHGEGLPLDGKSPNPARALDVQISGALKTPAALVLRALSPGDSIEARLSKIAAQYPSLALAGWILNQSAEAPISQGISGRVPKLGAMSKGGAAPPSPPRSPSEAKNMGGLPLAFLHQAAQIASKEVDIDALLLSAQNVLSVRLADFDYQPTPRRTRIAFADDACFHLCFQDNLDLLRYFGAELVPFSPLADLALPEDIGGLYMPGGFLADYGVEIAKNRDILDSIKSFFRTSGVIYAEGSGSAVLADEFQCGVGGPLAKGAGILPGRASFKPNAVSYIDAKLTEDSILGESGALAKGIETGEWRFEERERIFRGIRASRPRGGDFLDGFSPGAHTLCSFPFLHFGSNIDLARNFVDSAQVRSPIRTEA